MIVAVAVRACCDNHLVAVHWWRCRRRLEFHSWVVFAVGCDGVGLRDDRDLLLVRLENFFFFKSASFLSLSRGYFLFGQTDEET